MFLRPQGEFRNQEQAVGVKEGSAAHLWRELCSWPGVLCIYYCDLFRLAEGEEGDCGASVA